MPPTRAGTVLGAVLVATGCVAQLPNGVGQDAGGPAPVHPAGTPTSAASGAPQGATTGCGGEYDPHNCGSCGNDCGGGECDYGTCMPLAAGVLATGQVSPRDLAIDAANVYWLRESPPALMVCSKLGCDNRPTVLATGAWATLGRLAVDATNVYFTADHDVLACSIHGCPGGPTVLWSSGPTGAPGPIAVDATRVYATDAPGLPSVYSCPITGCPSGPALEWSPLLELPPDVNGGYAPIALAVDTTTIFGLLEQGAVMAFAPGGAANDTSWLISQRLGLVDLAIDATDVFVVNGDELGGQLFRCAKSGCDRPPVTLVSTLSQVVRITSDGAFVFMSEWGDGSSANSGRVAKCPVDGCPDGPIPIAGYVNYPLGIAVDDAHVYFTDSGSLPDSERSADGRVMAVAK